MRSAVAGTRLQRVRACFARPNDPGTLNNSISAIMHRGHPARTRLQSESGKRNTSITSNTAHLSSKLKVQACKLTGSGTVSGRHHVDCGCLLVEVEVEVAEPSKLGLLARIFGHSRRCVVLVGSARNCQVIVCRLCVQRLCMSVQNVVHSVASRKVPVISRVVCTCAPAYDGAVPCF